MEASKRSRLITTVGSTGSFQGFISTIAQNVTIQGPFCYDQNGVANGLTMAVVAGQHVPIQCTRIIPGSGNVIGLLP